MMIPNGLITHLVALYRALQNDCSVLNESGLLLHIKKYTIQPGSFDSDLPDCCFFQFYGDSAYGVSPYIISPYTGADALTPQQWAWNVAMGGTWILVEHGFSLVLQEWPYLNCFWKHKILGNMCGLLYHVAVLLTNAHACMVPNQTLEQYSCPPPSVEEYFHA